jgi:hypothetical protein
MLILFARKNASKTFSKKPIEKAGKNNISDTFYILHTKHEKDYINRLMIRWLWKDGNCNSTDNNRFTFLLMNYVCKCNSRLSRQS